MEKVKYQKYRTEIMESNVLEKLSVKQRIYTKTKREIMTEQRTRQKEDRVKGGRARALKEGRRRLRKRVEIYISIAVAILASCPSPSSADTGLWPVQGPAPQPIPARQPAGPSPPCGSRGGSSQHLESSSGLIYSSAEKRNQKHSVMRSFLPRKEMEAEKGRGG